MDKITATYRIVTPMFMSGQDKNKAELRPSSFKGALRFWYRAIAPTIFQENWEEIREREQLLFGSANSGQAGFLLRLQAKDNIEPIPIGKCRWNIGSSYLGGYGIINRNKNIRSYLPKGQSFTVSLLLKPQKQNKKAAQEYAPVLINSLIALGLFGGLGSRSRRGFGSVCLESLRYKDKDYWTPPQNSQELKEQMEKYFSELGPSIYSDLPEYSAFSAHSRIAITGHGSNPLALLDQVGEEMIRYRSYGINISGTYKLPWRAEAEQLFSDDHDLIWGGISGKTPTTHPRRAFFGLPHNYRFSNNKIVNVVPENYERRASPLLIHIHQLDNQYVAVLTLLAARFLPPTEKIKIAIRGGSTYKVAVAESPNYQVLHDFINRFPRRLEVTF